VPALAAGNTVVVKPSEVSPTVAGVLAELIPQYVDPDAVAVVTGGARETTVLLEQRFDHIMYTGNGAIGRVVMTAAARHLTPVTLELGGCSPTIVAADANIAVAARRIAYGKFINAGQTCVAPNHVLVEEPVEQAFLEALVAAITEFYGDDPSSSPDYGRMVNERHHDRVLGLLADGGYERTVTGGNGDRATRYIAPTVLAGVRPDAAVMGQEIFGPVLPVIAVRSIDEAIRSVNAQDKPLALYAFSANRRTLQHIVEHTSSGGMTLNHVVQHVGAPNLPLGGVGPSGMGAYNGETGFLTFSHSKSVLAKPTRPDPTVLFPPYTDLKQRIVRRLTPIPRATRRRRPE
jgi:aldehyde dehydrogenase (NAD+)